MRWIFNRPLHTFATVLLWSACAAVLLTDNAPADDPAVPPWPTAGLLPKQETGALRFLEQHPEYDGRNVVVAIFDTGVDPAAAGLTTTSAGQPKIIDLIDATGDGDVILSEELAADNGTLPGLTGHTLTVNPTWTNPSGKYRRGIKHAYELFPEELVTRLKKERREDWNRRQASRAAELRQALLTWKNAHPKPTTTEQKERDELQARIDVLKDAQKNYDDPGPIHDCVAWHDGSHWQAVVDTDEDGDLADEQALSDYRLEHQFASFSDASQLNFSVNFYDDGKVLSLVTVSGSHGTHVAGIVAAYESDHPERNGIAPGAQIVSIKIGDNRVAGMETGRALVRGLRAVIDHKCDLINMSYGEPSGVADGGRLPELMSELVHEHGVIFVASAGNSGPALSTVGAPGGTTEALLGIGAYVSPAMMSPQYGVRETLDGMPYNWTSRGPTTDGAIGVDLFAPGGAFSPVPNYSLQRSMQMNGTSMAAPNACGNIALLLSGLKAEEKTFTPALLRRALENTAVVLPEIDRFAQGAGLIQIDATWNWLDEHSSVEELAFDVRVGNDDARGVLLRESEEMTQPFQTHVRVAPHFPKSFPKREQVELELPVTLKTTAKWVDSSANMLLTTGGSRFDLRVTPTRLKTGPHFAEVLGYAAGREDRGPLFRLPVTVIRPEHLDRPEVRRDFRLGPGGTQRIFLTVPEGASWADIALRLNTADTQRTLVLHTVQTLPSHAFEDGERREYVGMEAGDESIISVPVVDGRTLEVCLSQYWLNLGESNIDMTVAFRGLQPDDDDLTLPSDGSPLEVEVTSRIRRERLNPNGTFTTLRRLLRPKSVEQTALRTARDRQLDGGPTAQLVARYSFSLTDKHDVTIGLPVLDNLLYDSPVESQFWQLFDANNRLIASNDMYLDAVKLEKGDYTVAVELRHADPNVLSAYELAVLTVDMSLPKSISVGLHSARTAKTTREATFLDPGESSTVFFTGPAAKSVPSAAQPGDWLLGRMQFVASPSGTEGATTRPGGYPIRFLIGPTAKDADANDKSEPSADETPAKPLAERLQQEELDLLIKQVGKLTWPADSALFEQLSDRILKEHPNAKQRVLVARLHLVDGDNRKEHLPEVIATADAMIDSVKPGEWMDWLSQRADSDRPEAARQKKDAEKQRDILVDALYRKGRAIAYRELPDVVEKHPIEDQAALDESFESTFRELARWVDTTEPEYALLHIRRDRRAKRYGLALKLLNELATKSTPSKWLHHKKRRDIYELIGWDDWSAYEHKRMLIQFPDADNDRTFPSDVAR